MPSLYREMELGLRTQIASALERGKVDFSIFIESTAEQTTTGECTQKLTSIN
jgi:uncharacterized protein YicC (UPF0701 family)